MSIAYNTSIVRDGLICCLDPASVKSYTGSGSTVTDVSGNGNNGTITGSITLTDNVFQFTSGNYITTTLNLSVGTYTVMASARWTGGLNGRIITSSNNNWLMGHWAGTTENHYAEGWVSAVSSGAGDTNWRIYAASGNSPIDSWQMYVNGIQTYSNSNGSAGPNAPGINCNVGEHSNGQCGIFMVYNRVLTVSEIYRNFEALRGRHGI